MQHGHSLNVIVSDWECMIICLTCPRPSPILESMINKYGHLFAAVCLRCHIALRKLAHAIYRDF